MGQFVFKITVKDIQQYVPSTVNTKKSVMDPCFSLSSADSGLGVVVVVVVVVVMFVEFVSCVEFGVVMVDRGCVVEGEADSVSWLYIVGEKDKKEMKS